MPGRKAARLLVGLSAAIAVLGMAVSAEAQEKKIKIGVIFDLTGPLAGGGSELQYTGAKIMLDHYAKTGVEGYKVEAVYADAQSKPDVAINEAVRLIEQEKVDMVMGFFSSAQCVPVAARVEQLKKFMWITTCISSGVFDEQELQIRLPAAGQRRPVRHDDDGLHRRRTPRRSSARSRRTCASPSSTRTAPMASTSPRATRPAPRRPASTSC